MKTNLIKQLTEKQKRHLENVEKYVNRNQTHCLHNGCSKCHGTGKKLNGEFCVHFISCPCPSCSVTF